MDAAILRTPRDSHTFPTCSRVMTGVSARTSLVCPLHMGVVSRHARATLIKELWSPLSIEAEGKKNNVVFFEVLSDPFIFETL